MKLGNKNDSKICRKIRKQLYIVVRVTACPNIVALKLAGFQNVKLYAGSWSDWISYPKIKLQKKKINHLHAKIICIKIRSQARDCSKNFVFYTLETM